MYLLGFFLQSFSPCLLRLDCHSLATSPPETARLLDVFHVYFRWLELIFLLDSSFTADTLPEFPEAAGLLLLSWLLAAARFVQIGRLPPHRLLIDQI